jgi:hypothetical protein
MTRAERNRRSSLPVSRNLIPIRISDSRQFAVPSVGASQQTVRHHKPRNTWHQRGWSGVSPYYATAITVDRRWDK